MKRLLFILLILIFVTTGVFAESVEEYTVRPGDVLSISIMGFPEYAQDVIVMPDGTISLDFGIDLKVSGLTLKMIRDMIGIEYGLYLRNPIVSVKVRDFHSMFITVVGEVNLPGRYEFKPLFGTSPTIYDAVGMAGGVTNNADAKSIALIRDDSEDSAIVYFDMNAFNQGQSIGTNYILRDGDFVYVPKRVEEVLVLGEVQRPGSYELEKGTTVIDFVALAGGVTDKANTKIIHTRNVDGKAKVTEIDLDVIMKDKADPANLTVEAGDMIVVPELKKLTVESTLNILTLVKLITDLFK